jgi:hypothetical protein
MTKTLNTLSFLLYLSNCQFINITSVLKTKYFFQANPVTKIKCDLFQIRQKKNRIDDNLLSIAHFINLHHMTFTKVLETLVPSSKLVLA